MPSMNHTTDTLRVKQIVIDEEGNVAKRFPRIDAEGQLKNTLLFAMHPEICVLSMQVPGGLLDAYEQARISQVLMRVRYEGREYCLIGASGSAKDGKFYAVDADQVTPENESQFVPIHLQVFPWKHGKLVYHAQSRSRKIHATLTLSKPEIGSWDTTTEVT